MSTAVSRYWPWFFFTTAIESLIAIFRLLSLPSEGGLSAARLLLLAPLAALFILGIVLGWRSTQANLGLDKFARTSIIVAAGVLAWTLGAALFLLRYADPEHLLRAYERASPLLWCGLIVALETAFFLLWLRNGFDTRRLLSFQSTFRFAAIAFAALLLILLFVALTRIGVQPDTAYWGEPGVPLILWQFILALTLGGWTFVFSMMFPRLESSVVWRLGLPILLYASACALWLSVPWQVLSSSFYAPISPPTNIPLPYSDAGFYDYLSQSLLIGARYLGSIPPRPLYVLLLGLLHAAFGQNYPAIIAAQTFLLALFPVAIYLLGKEIHSAAAGVTAALFAIFRELVALWISSNTRVANTKTFTTDFPTALGIALLCIAVIWWLRRRTLSATLIAGGTLGLLLLIRTQSLLILPAMLALAWFAYARTTSAWLKASVTFAVAVGLVIAPWLIRNRVEYGSLSFDDPSQMAIIYAQYSFNDNLDLSQFDPQRDGVSRHLISFTAKNPAYVARFISAHFLNTEIGGLLTLPLIEKFDGLSAPVNLYWLGWDGSLEWYNFALLLCYLMLLALGISAAWTRARWLGLVPLVANLAYALANGISRFSSWRYNLPVDWVIYFYVSIGAMELLCAAATLFASQIAISEAVVAPNVKTSKPRAVALIALVPFVLVGSLPWLAEGFWPARYTADQPAMISRFSALAYSDEDLKTFLSSPNALIFEGRMLYPRMYRRDEGIVSTNPWAAYAVRDFPRLGFLVINAHQSTVILPTKDLLPFTQGADVTVLGCQKDSYIDARLVIMDGEFYQSGALSACP